VAIGIISGIDTLARAIGDRAADLLLAGIVLIGGSISISIFGSIRWSQFAVAMHGAGFICASLALVSMMSNKNVVESATLNDSASEDSRAPTESVRVDVASLVVGAIGFAMVGVSYFSRLPFENGQSRETVLTKVAGLGWLLLGVAIVIDRTRLVARFGPRAVRFGVIAAALLGLYALLRFFVEDMSLGDAVAYKNFTVLKALGYVSAGLACWFFALHNRDEQGSDPGDSQQH